MRVAGAPIDPQEDTRRSRGRCPLPRPFCVATDVVPLPLLLLPTPPHPTPNLLLRRFFSARTAQILYGAVSEEEKKQITPVVYANTITSMKILVEQATALGEEVRARPGPAGPGQKRGAISVDVGTGFPLERLLS